MTGNELAKYVDHTLLAADATAAKIAGLCAEAVHYGFATVCVNPYWVRLAAANLADSGVGVCSVVGFPLGASPTAVKVFEAETAIADGASEIDMVMNIGAAKSGDWQTVEEDIRAVAAAVHSAGGKLKVILETCLLSGEEIRRSCAASVDAGADFVKTSTGFAAAGATIGDVAVMAGAVGGKAAVKASGGIRDRATAEQMITAGASRLGTSSGIRIVKGGAAKGEGY